jgi:hypothetical protein
VAAAGLSSSSRLVLLTGTAHGCAVTAAPLAALLLVLLPRALQGSAATGTYIMMLSLLLLLLLRMLMLLLPLSACCFPLPLLLLLLGLCMLLLLLLLLLLPLLLARSPAGVSK